MTGHVRWQETLPLRVPEWLSASMMTLWGWVVLSDPYLFASQSSFKAMAAFVAQPIWGWTALMCGFGGLIGLGVNGFWVATPVIRATAAIGRMLLWIGIFFGLAFAGRLTTGLPVYIGLAGLEIWNIYRAGGDARVAMRR